MGLADILAAIKDGDQVIVDSTVVGSITGAARDVDNYTTDPGNLEIPVYFQIVIGKLLQDIFQAVLVYFEVDLLSDKLNGQNKRHEVVVFLMDGKNSPNL